MFIGFGEYKNKRSLHRYIKLALMSRPGLYFLITQIIRLNRNFRKERISFLFFFLFLNFRKERISKSFW